MAEGAWRYDAIHFGLSLEPRNPSSGPKSAISAGSAGAGSDSEPGRWQPMQPRSVISRLPGSGSPAGTAGAGAANVFQCAQFKFGQQFIVNVGEFLQLVAVKSVNISLAVGRRDIGGDKAVFAQRVTIDNLQVVDQRTNWPAVSGYDRQVLRPGIGIGKVDEFAVS